MLSPKVSVLVCHSQQPNAEKSRFAASKQIPVVKAQWLWDCISSGETKPYTPYLLSPATGPPQPPKRKAQGLLNEVPTEPLPRPNNTKLQQKKAPVQKTAANARDASRQPRTLELSVSAPSTASPSTTEPNTTAHHSHLELGHNHNQDHDHDDDHDAQPPAQYDGADSLPLQEVDPSVNTARRPSSANLATRSAKPQAQAQARANAQPQAHATSSPSAAADLPLPIDASPSPQPVPAEPEPEPSHPALPQPPPQPTTTASAPALVTEPPSGPPVTEPPPEEKDYSDIMTRLLATRKTSAPAPLPIPDDEANLNGRRRRRPLGRAQSSRSNASTTTTTTTAPADAETLSRPSSASGLPAPERPNQESHNETQLTSDDAALLHTLRPPEPSQQLGWDSPGAQRARERMIRAIGGTVEEKAGSGWGERGVVRDAKEGLEGVGRRARRRG